MADAGVRRSCRRERMNGRKYKIKKSGLLHLNLNLK